ncbi:dihydropyrimidinase [Nocardioides sp.]|uniref:dihydropyrimidinase n=1 Tax=Nocardioides sp. TaxID=35761 RepID=UPI00260A9894|nr:dihydropyrimidinase [Nocardioides sp.]MDI6908572.1 dihydropyrimidinase [Nocardioides sp.]
MKRIHLQGGTVVNSGSSVVADVLIEDGCVVAIGKNLVVEDAEAIDCAGRYVMPGGVDVHTHLDAPMMNTKTADDFASGTRAAAVGGTTTIVDFALQAKGQKLEDALNGWHQKAIDKCAIDYGFHVAITDLYDGAIADIEGLVRSGVTSMKIYMAYKGAIMLDDGEMYEVLRESGRLGAKTCVHAENGDVIDRISANLVASGKTGPENHALSRPPATEVEAVNRAIAVSRIADAPIYFVHLSTGGATEAVAEAQLNGWPVAGETCTHYLTLGPDLYDLPDFEAAKAVLTPPLRDSNHQEALWRGLNNGTLGIVSSDHCPFCFVGQKDLGRHDFRAIPNGGAGIEDRMRVMYGTGVAGGRISLEQFVALTSTNPAKSFGMFPTKGFVGIGADADIIVLDPAATTHISAATQHQALDYNLWEGWTLPGAITHVFSRGELIASNGRFVGREGHGNYLARSAV